MASQSYIIEKNDSLLPMENILEDIISAATTEKRRFETNDIAGKFYPGNMAEWQNLNGRLIYLSVLVERAKNVLRSGGCN